MAQSLMLPAVVLLVGLVTALLLTAPSHLKKQTDDATQPVEAG